MTTENVSLQDIIGEYHDNMENDYMTYGEDNHGDKYLLFENHKDVESFVKLAGEMLNKEFEHDYEVEREFDLYIAFTDEYTTCDDCGAIIRTEPNSYHWTPDYYLGDGFIICNECFNNEKDYQEAYLVERINNPNNANTILSDEQLEELGFTKFNSNSYEHGFHHGQTDDPREIYKEIENLYYDIIFSIDGVGQFDTHFSVWVRGEI